MPEAKIDSPRIWQPDGAPAFWAYLEGPNGRTGGDVGDLQGTWSGARSGGCTWSRGPLGRFLNFDTTGAVTFTTRKVHFERNQPFSVGAKLVWSTTNAQSIVGNLNTAASYQGWEFQYEGNASLQLFFINTWTTNAFLATFLFTPVFGRIYNVVCAYDGSSLVTGVRMWVDGLELVMETPVYNTLTATTVPTSSLRIGRRMDSTIGYGSGIHEIRIFNRHVLPGDPDFDNSDWRLMEPRYRTRWASILPQASAFNRRTRRTQILGSGTY